MSKPEQETQAAWANALRLVEQRNEAALASLYDQTSAYVHSLALRILGDHADAEEVTMDVYVQVWSKAASYETSRGTPLGWLLMMTRSRSIDRLRSRTVPAEQVNLQVLASGEPDPELGHRKQEQSALMTDLVGSLPVEQQTLIERAFFQGMTQTEMAAVLQLPLGTVKTRMRLALKKLRAMLEGSGQLGVRNHG